MKKSLFKVLCMVLIIALLAPNAFAATPTPEAPLADAATVARVKQEIANGEITDTEDLFLVAYQHLGADLEEEGMTAYINEDGTLSIIQNICSSNARRGSTEQDFAVTSVALLDTEGNALPFSIDTMIGSDSATLNSISVTVTHTAFIRRNYISLDEYEFKLGYMKTDISYNLTTFAPVLLEHRYVGQQYAFEGTQTASERINNPEWGSHTFNPDNTTWYESGYGYTGGIRTTVKIWFSNTTETIELHTAFSLMDRVFV